MLTIGDKFPAFDLRAVVSLGELLPTVQPSECANYFVKAGYARI